jgi:hypothetical protein
MVRKRHDSKTVMRYYRARESGEDGVPAILKLLCVKESLLTMSTLAAATSLTGSDAQGQAKFVALLSRIAA